MTKKLNEKLGLKIIDDAIHLTNERLHGGKDKVTVTYPPSFLKDYSGCRLSVHCHFRIWVTDLDRKEFCAIFSLLHRALWWSNGGGRAICGRLLEREGRLLLHDKDPAMFIDVVELRDDPQITGGRISWPSLVWLQRFDPLTCYGANEASVLSEPRVEPCRGSIGLKAPNDGELGFAACRGIARLNCELANKVV